MPVVSHSSTPLYVDWAQRYEILRKVGAGGFAEVYEAYDRKLERPVALKVIADRPGMSGRVVREVEAAASLAHPNIVALYDFFGDGERSFLVWEFVEGRPLAAAQGELGDADAVMVGEQLAEALAYAHSQGVIHRDIKPQNVMIGDEGRAKLMDFGIARLMDAQTLTSEGDVLGTVAYMSPEQASSGRIGPASDVYSLGIVLYELLAGFNPVRGHTPAETMANVVAGRFEPLEEVRPDLPRSVTDAVDAATETVAGERPSAAAVAAELHAALDSGRLGHGRLRAWRVLRPLQRFAVLGERAAGAALAAVVTAVLLGRFATYPEGWTLPVLALSAALWFVVPQLGLAWLLGVLAFPVFAVSFSLGIVYMIGAVALYWLTRGRPLVALWPALAVLLAPVYADLPGAGGSGRLRPPARPAGGRVGRRRRALLPAGRARRPFAVHGLPASRPSRRAASGGRQPFERRLPGPGRGPLRAVSVPDGRVGWAGAGGGVHLVAAAHAGAPLGVVAQHVPRVRALPSRADPLLGPPRGRGRPYRRCLGVGGGVIVRGGLRRGATSRGAT